MSDQTVSDQVDVTDAGTTAHEYTPFERLALVASRIVAQSTVVAASVSTGQLHPLGVYQNEYGKIVQMGKPQRKALVGMILYASIIQELTDAFLLARESPEGQTLLAKTQFNSAAEVGQEGQRPC